MSLRILSFASIALALASCGVKTDLDRPMVQLVQQRPALQNPQKDASKPPVPLGEPGGTTPPYTTGP